jgi:hypothetical protein
MSDQPTPTSPGPISVEQLTEAVARGVLQALSSPAFAREKAVDVAQLAAERGIFGQLVIICGFWPTGKEPPIGGPIVGGIGGQGAPQ